MNFTGLRIATVVEIVFAFHDFSFILFYFFEKTKMVPSFALKLAKKDDSNSDSEKSPFPQGFCSHSWLFGAFAMFLLLGPFLPLQLAVSELPMPTSGKYTILRCHNLQNIAQCHYFNSEVRR